MRAGEPEASDQPVSQLQARPGPPAEPPGLSWPGSQGRSISRLDLPATRATSPALVLTCGDGGSGQGGCGQLPCCAATQGVSPLGCPWLLHAGPCPPSLSSWRCVMISATMTNDLSRRMSPPVNAALTRGWKSGNWRPRGRGSGHSVSPGGAGALGSWQQPSCAHPVSKAAPPAARVSPPPSCSLPTTLSLELDPAGNQDEGRSRASP